MTRFPGVGAAALAGNHKGLHIWLRVFRRIGAGLPEEANRHNTRRGKHVRITDPGGIVNRI